MRFSVTVLTAALVTSSLVACSNGNAVPQTPSISADGSASKTSVAPVELRSSAILAKIHAAAGFGRADAVKPGIYASANSVIYGYSGNDRSNAPPVCSVAGGGGPVAVDRQGDLIVPDAGADTITVYAGPGLCGPKLGTIANLDGAPEGVASRNVANGGMIVVSIYRLNRGQHDSVSVCKLSGRCSAELRTPGMCCLSGFVALAPNGDCWASGGTKPARAPALAYFAHCHGLGVLATGFETGVVGFAAGGLDIDDNGNLVATSYATGGSELYIYSGCNPACTLVGGPFPLRGGVADSHLDANSKMFVAADNQNSQLDVYSYSTSGVKYEYSITNGLSSGVTGAAFSPSSKE